LQEDDQMRFGNPSYCILKLIVGQTFFWCFDFPCVEERTVASCRRPDSQKLALRRDNGRILMGWMLCVGVERISKTVVLEKSCSPTNVMGEILDDLNLKEANHRAG